MVTKSENGGARVGVLTGGGDCPGLNAVIRAIVRRGIFHYKDEMMGFLEGWRGVAEDDTVPLDLKIFERNDPKAKSA